MAVNLRKIKKLKYWETNTSITVVDINLGDERIVFNLKDELSFDNDSVNLELKDQPNHYAFIAMLHKKALVLKRERERILEKTRSRLFSQYKSQEKMANDLAEAMVYKSKEYQDDYKKFLAVSADVDILEVCVRAFEQRSMLMQTVSANIRRDKV
jgi:hypothetical protein